MPTLAPERRRKEGHPASLRTLLLNPPCVSEATGPEPNQRFCGYRLPSTCLAIVASCMFDVPS